MHWMNSPRSESRSWTAYPPPHQSLPTHHPPSCVLLSHRVDSYRELQLLAPPAHTDKSLIFGHKRLSAKFARAS